MSSDDNMGKILLSIEQRRPTLPVQQKFMVCQNDIDIINYTHVQTGMPLRLPICLSLYIKFLCALLLNAWYYIHIDQKLKIYVMWSAQRIKMNCKKILFLKCLRQFLHFFI